MRNPNAHVPLGTITDRDGRKIDTQWDFGDFLLGSYRLTADNRRQLRSLLDEADAKSADYEAAVADDPYPGRMG